MFKKQLIALILLIVLAVAIMPCANATTDEQQAADALFNMLDLTKPGLEAIASAYISANYTLALSLYRDLLLSRLRGYDFTDFPWHTAYTTSYNLSNAKVWIGKLSLSDYNAAFPNIPIYGEYYWGISSLPTDTPNIDWLALPPNATVPDQFWFRWFTNLPAAYLTYNDSDYLKKWFQILENYSLYNKTSCEAAYAQGLINKDDYRSWQYRNNFIFGANARTNFIIRQLAALCKAMPSNTGARPSWTNVLRPVSTAVQTGANELIPPVRLARIVVSLVRDHAPYFVEWYANQTGAVPNQRVSGLCDLAMMSLIFSDFSYVQQTINPKVKAGFMDYFSRSQYPDGGMIEQAFNYNLGDYGSMQRLNTLFNSAGQTPDYTPELLNAITYTGRIFDALKRPIGGVPSVGMGGIDQSSPIWESATNIQKWKSGSIYDVVAQGGYSSIGFPYVGYYAMRKGWGINDGYLFMQSPRRSKGHLYPSNGSIELIWGGRHLLMQGGAPWYFTTDCPSDLLGEFTQFNSYFGETSTFDRNTVIVNGMSQLKENIIDNLNGQPTLPYVWHTSNYFDIAQAGWNGGYGAGTTKITDITHDRKVIYVKDAELFMVTDIMSSQTAGRSYSQLWNFPPSLRKANGDTVDVYGFNQNDINLNQSSKLIKTAQANSPNLYIYQSYPSPISYSLYYGYRPSQGQYLGWYSPGLSGVRYPKPDVHVGFDGLYPLVSALIPTNGTAEPVSSFSELSSGSVSGLYLKKGNLDISYFASKTGAALSANNINANAATLLMVSDGTVRKGIALNCNSFIVDGANISIPVGSFEFYISNTGVKLYNLSAPDSFAWETGTNLSPVYFANKISIQGKTFSQAGVPISGEIPMGDIDCSLSVKNNHTSALTADLIATSYINNKLSAIKIKNITLEAGEARRETVTVKSLKVGSNIKLLAFESLQALKPIYQEN